MNLAKILLAQLMNSPKVNNNPMAKNVLDMAQQGNMTGIEMFGRNIAKERGVDFDTEFQNFKNRFSR